MIGLPFQAGLVIGGVDGVAFAVMAEIMDAGGEHQKCDFGVVAGLVGILVEGIVGCDEADRLEQNFLVMFDIVIGECVGDFSQNCGDGEGFFEVGIEGDFETISGKNAQREHGGVIALLVPALDKTYGFFCGVMDVTVSVKEKITLILEVGEIVEDVLGSIFIGALNGLQCRPAIMWREGEEDVLYRLNCIEPSFCDVFWAIHRDFVCGYYKCVRCLLLAKYRCNQNKCKHYWMIRMEIIGFLWFISTLMN